MVLKNFATIKGDVECSNDTITYTNAKTNEDEVQVRKIPAIVRSSETFANGTISFNVKYTDSQSSFFCLFSTMNEKSLIVGYNRVTKSFLIRYLDEDNEKSLDSAGSLDSFSSEALLNIKIEVKGSSIFLYVNNILMCNASVSLKEAPISFLFNGQHEVIIKNVTVDKKRQSVFVIMQFTQEYNDLYEQVIIPVVEKFDLKCIRADDIYTATPILADIINEIKAASIIVADITPDNPNVFYELGFAHAINKPTIVLSEKQRTKLPFDVSGLRTIFYDNSIVGKSKVERSLSKYIEKILEKN